MSAVAAHALQITRGASIHRCYMRALGPRLGELGGVERPDSIMICRSNSADVPQMACPSSLSSNSAAGMRVKRKQRIKKYKPGSFREHTCHMGGALPSVYGRHLTRAKSKNQAVRSTGGTVCYRVVEIDCANS